MRKKIVTSIQVADLLREQLSDLDHEELWGLFLASDFGLIAYEMLTKGTLTMTLIDARCVIKRSLLMDAVHIILVHNHPTGSSAPSRADIAQTRKVHEACALMDISLMDHVILAREDYYSFAEERKKMYLPKAI